jgi:hypothetical protein
VLLRQGEILGGRGKLGFLAAAAVLLGAVVVIVYFTVFPIPRPAGAGHARPGPPLDQNAVGVANAFTKLAWDEYNCRAAGRYSLGLRHCASRLLPQERTSP